MKFVSILLTVILAGSAGAAIALWQPAAVKSFPWIADTGNASTSTQSRPAARVAVEVETAEDVVSTADVRTVGTLLSDESVQLVAEVAGQVAEIRFKDGQSVRAGDILLSLDKSLAAAALEEIQAKHMLASTAYERAEKLAGSGTGTVTSLEIARAEFDAAAALLKLQQVQLAKHDIVAPFRGVTGLRNISTGSYAAVGTPLLSLDKIDVLKVDFRLPEIHLGKIRIGQAVEVSVDAVPDRVFPGEIAAIDPVVDVNGRAIRVRASLPNADLILRPGLFARVIIKGSEEFKAVTVPESAITARGQEQFVWTVSEGKALQTKVTIQSRKAGTAQINGIQAGSTVVTAGQARLRDGVNVEVIGKGEDAKD